MNSFVVVGVLAFLVASVAMPTLAQTGPNPPAATMPPAPTAPSSPLAPLNTQHVHTVRPAQSTQLVQHTAVTRVKPARVAAPSHPTAALKR